MKAQYTLFILLLTSSIAVAQENDHDLDTLLDLSLEQLMNIQITTASKTASKADVAPSVLDIITGEQIRQRGYQQLGQVLNDIANNHEDRANWGIGEPVSQNVGFGFRFDTGQNILLLFNGQRLNAFLPGNRFGGEEYLLDNIERIEIIRGPGSALYGTGAFTAVVNIISKKIQADKDERSSMSIDYVPTSAGKIVQGTTLLKAGASGTFNAAIRSFSEDGQSLLVRNSLFGDRKIRDGVKHALDAEVIYTNQDFSLFAKHTHQIRNTFTGFNSVSPSDEKVLDLTMKATSIGTNYTLKTGQRSDLKFSAGWHTDNWTEVALIPQFKVNADGSSLLYDGNGLPLLDTISLYRNGETIMTSFFIDGQGSDTQSMDGEIQFTCNYRKQNYLVAGLYFADDRITHAERPTELNLQPLMFVPFRTITDPANNWLFDVNASRQTVAAYTQFDYSFNTHFSLTGGVRLDRYSGKGALRVQEYTETNPRIAFVYNQEQAGTIKAIAGTATRVPNGFETLSSVSILGNPNNKPERITTLQLQWIKNWNSNWRTEAGVFRSEISDRLETNADLSDAMKAQGFVGQFLNIGAGKKQVNNGIDAKMIARFDAHTVTMTATRYFGSSDGNGNPLAYIPMTMINFDYQLKAGITSLNIGGNYRGDFTKSSGDTRDRVRNYFVARMNFIVTPNGIPFTFRITGRNIFNTTYAFPSSSADFYNHFPARKFEMQVGVTYNPSLH